MTSRIEQSDLAGLDALSMVQGFSTGSFDPVDVLDAALARIDRLDAGLNAFVMRDQTARACAEASTQRYKAGQSIGPLDGVPIALKDNLAAAGMPASWGSRVFAGTICAADELPVERLRVAGAVVVGKTNTPEFAVEGYTGNALFGVTANPWNPALTPGGSSGGSVAAVAARMLPIAFGTDGGGSIRRPAAYTGLVGLKPTIGRVARHGGLPQVLLDFEVVSPVARTVADVAAAFAAVSGSDRRDPSSRCFPAGQEDHLRSERKLRILYVERFGDAPCDPQIRRSSRGLADVLADLGHEVREGELPISIARLNEVWPSIGAIGLARLCAELPAMRALAGSKYLEMADRAASLGVVQLASIMEAVRDLRARASECFATLDVIMTPSCAAMPWPADVSHPEMIDGEPVGPRGHAIYTGWVNAIGHPAIAVPAAPAEDGMPIGVQLVGDLGREAVLLALAGEIEQAQPWADLVPAMVQRDIVGQVSSP